MKSGKWIRNEKENVDENISEFNRRMKRKKWKEKMKGKRDHVEEDEKVEKK